MLKYFAARDYFRDLGYEVAIIKSDQKIIPMISIEDKFVTFFDRDDERAEVFDCVVAVTYIDSTSSYSIESFRDDCMKTLKREGYPHLSSFLTEYLNNHIASLHDSFVSNRPKCNFTQYVNFNFNLASL